MKNFIRISLLNTFSLYVVASFFSGLIIPSRLLELIWAGIVFTLINYFVKPIVKLFLLPINLMTLGLFRWIGNVIILLILTKVTQTVAVKAFTLPAYSQAGFAIPALSINLFFSYLLASLLLSFVFNLFEAILNDE